MPSLAALPDALEPIDRVALEDELAAEQFRYLQEFRRVVISPAISLVFENRQTLWFRLQELARVERHTGSQRIRTELDWYSKLLPSEDTLRAAIWIGLPGRRSSRNWAHLREAVARGVFAFEDSLGQSIPGQISTSRVVDPLIGLSLWVEFPFSASTRTAFEEPNRGWHITLRTAAYTYTSEPLTDTVWHSLNEDMMQE